MQLIFRGVNRETFREADVNQEIHRSSPHKIKNIHQCRVCTTSPLRRNKELKLVTLSTLLENCGDTTHKKLVTKKISSMGCLSLQAR